MRCSGFDSIRITRGQTNSPYFQALLGVGITVNDVDSFKRHYDLLFDDLFSRFKTPRKKPIYKSYDLKRLFYPSSSELITEIVTELSKEIDMIDIYYSYFLKKNPKYRLDPENEPEFTGETMDNIKVFGDDPNKSKTITGLELLDLLEHQYSALCAWNYHTFVGQRLKTHMWVDDIGGSTISRALKSLEGNQDFSIVVNGDKCNHLISTADIFVNFINLKLVSGAAKVNQNLVNLFETQLQSKMKTVCMGNNFLSWITPRISGSIDKSRHLVHPIYFILREDVASIKGTDEKQFLEDTPVMDYALKLAAENNGCVKIFESLDQPFIQSKDTFIYYGIAGEAKAKVLEAVGYHNICLSAMEFLEKEKTETNCI